MSRSQKNVVSNQVFSNEQVSNVVVSNERGLTLKWMVSKDLVSIVVEPNQIGWIGHMTSQGLCILGLPERLCRLT